MWILYVDYIDYTFFLVNLDLLKKKKIDFKFFTLERGSRFHVRAFIQRDSF